MSGWMSLAWQLSTTNRLLVDIKKLRRTRFCWQHNCDWYLWTQICRKACLKDSNWSSYYMHDNSGFFFPDFFRCWWIRLNFLTFSFVTKRAGFWWAKSKLAKGGYRLKDKMLFVYLANMFGSFCHFHKLRRSRWEHHPWIRQSPAII